jgi:hypothetical protein
LSGCGYIGPTPSLSLVITQAQAADCPNGQNTRTA